MRTKVSKLLVAEARINRMQDKLDRIAELKAQRDQLLAEIEGLELEVLPLLKDYGKFNKTWFHAGVTFTGVWPTRTYYDEKGLRDELGEEIWQQIQKVSMDRDKLGGLVTAGVVEAQTVAKHATVADVKAYVLVTRNGAAESTTKAA